MKKLQMRLHELFILICIYACRAMRSFLPKGHWVIVERGNDARDNAYCFYRYMKINHPEKKVYYIIDFKSSDYDKVKADAVKLGSFKNYRVLATADRIVTTHYGSGMRILSIKLFRMMKLAEKVCFLQHGITKDDQKALYADYSPMRLFICGAQPEYEDISVRYGHPEGVVRYTGFARFDYLHDIETKNQVLMMPTWRASIKNESDFLKSEYFKRWQSVLADENLNRMLRERDTKLYFYVHYEMQKYVNRFKGGSENIIIARFDDYDVQKLLKESRLLITDYSSVFFDFAYMKKPMVFYQFDQYHYAKGYFDYQRDGFGRVCKAHDEVIGEIGAYMEKDFVLDEIYRQRIEKFFPIYDAQNCERIYRAIAEC